MIGNIFISTIMGIGMFFTRIPQTIRTQMNIPVSAAKTVMVSNMQFMPQEIDVISGTSVQWKNNDMLSHTVTSDNSGGTETWDSGILMPGQTFSRQFNLPGTYAYHCNIHPFMHGTVKVLAISQILPQLRKIPVVIRLPTIVLPQQVNSTVRRIIRTSRMNINPQKFFMSVRSGFSRFFGRRDRDGDFDWD